MTPEKIAERIIDDARKGGYVASLEWDAPIWDFEHERDHLVKDLAAAIAAALREERERCAKVADEHRARVRPHNPDQPKSDLVSQGYGNAALNIATAIRGETP